MAHQCRPELALCVYASGPDASRAEAMANQHLASMVTPAEMPSVLDALEGSSADHGREQSAPTAAPAVEDTTPREQPAEPPAVATEALAAGADDEQQPDALVEPPQTATSPTRRPPLPPNSPPVEDRPDVLLTQEELAALLGRDGRTDSKEAQP